MRQASGWSSAGQLLRDQGQRGAHFYRDPVQIPIAALGKIDSSVRRADFVFQDSRAVRLPRLGVVLAA
jgi:hypothetical protein